MLSGHRKHSSSVVSIYWQVLSWIPATGDEKFGVRTCFPSFHLQGCHEHSVPVPLIGLGCKLEAGTLCREIHPLCRLKNGTSVI